MKIKSRMEYYVRLILVAFVVNIYVTLGKLHYLINLISAVFQTIDIFKFSFLFFQIYNKIIFIKLRSKAVLLDTLLYTYAYFYQLSFISGSNLCRVSYSLSMINIMLFFFIKFILTITL